MNNQKVPEGFVLTQEELDNISQEDIDELEEIAEDYVDVVSEFEKELDEVMERINNSTIYEKMGIELHISVEYLYSYDETDES